jgi:hypothetical protein
LNFVEVPDAGPAPSSFEYFGDNLPMLRFGHRRIDGPNNILAFGYYPGDTGLSGDIHLDNSERWSASPSGGYDVLEVFTHEIGHTLGLGHSTNAPAIMNPFYAGRFGGPGTSRLLADDINGIRALYGTGRGSVTPLGSTPSSTPSNTFFVQGNTLIVRGTAGNDLITLTNTGNRQLTVNGVAFVGNLNSFATISIDAIAGADRVVIGNSSAADRWTLSPRRLTARVGSQEILVTNSSLIEINASREDSATLTDSTGNDNFTATATRARLTGTGFDLVVNSAGTVTQTFSSGTDRVNLTGTSTTDAVRATTSKIDLTGTGYRISTRGFDSATVNSGGGNDRAELQGSAGEDSVVASRSSAGLNSAGTSVTLNGFATLSLDAGLGNDRLLLVDSAGNDTLTASASRVDLTGIGWSIAAIGFNFVSITSTGGSDRATFDGTNGMYSADSTSKTATMSYTGTQVQIRSFASITVNNPPTSLARRLKVSYLAGWLGA